MNRNNDIAVHPYYQTWIRFEISWIFIELNPTHVSVEKIKRKCNQIAISKICLWYLSSFCCCCCAGCSILYWIIEMFIKIFVSKTKFHAYGESKSRRFYLSFWDINLWAFPCIWMNVIFMMPILTKRVCCMYSKNAETKM